MRLIRPWGESVKPHGADFTNPWGSSSSPHFPAGSPWGDTDPVATYGELLRTALDETRVSRRRLSFMLADAAGIQQDSAYRTIGKWLADDEQPSAERAEMVAELLGRPELAATTRQRRYLLRGLVAAVEKQKDTLDELARRVEALERAAEDSRTQRGGR